MAIDRSVGGMKTISVQPDNLEPLQPTAFQGFPPVVQARHPER